MNYENLYKTIENVIQKGCKPEKLCIILLNPNKKNNIEEFLKGKNIPVCSMNGFVKDILKNTPMALNSNILSDYLAIQIIKNISKEELSKNNVMKNLIKSDTFSRELYNLFGLYKVNKIASDDLYKITERTDIDIKDKERFLLTVNIYKKYCEILIKNNLMDYKDAVLNCNLVLQRSEFLRNNLRSKYEYIVVIDAQELNELQMELLNFVVKEDKLILFGDKNIRTHNYMGANSLLNNKLQKIGCENNKDILQRAEIFIQEQNEKLGHTNAIEYRKFNDFKKEIDFIVQDIIKKNNEGVPYSDFAILIRESSVKDSIVDLCQAYNLPVSGEIKSEEYENFKQDLYNYVEFCSLLEKLGLDNFHYKTFKQEAKIQSQYELKKYSEQLTESFRKISKNTFNFIKGIKNEDTKIFYFLNDLNNYYKNKEFVKFVLKIANIDKVKDETYHKFMAKYISNLTEIVQFNKKIFHNTCDGKVLLDLLEFIINDNDSSEDKVTITTFFKNVGMSYKYVYIPMLTDAYFPKKVKNTLFISEFSNIKLSEEIRKKYPNFSKIILSEKDELKDENNLMYSAMLSANKKIVLSTHKYDGNKLVIPSQYYEELLELDKENEVKIDDKDKVKIVQNVEYEEKNSIKTSENVVDENDELTLSASSIYTFLQCSRKFYYQKLLGLKTESSKSAIYGIAIHAIFENILSNHLNEFSKEKFIELGKILFTVPIDKEEIEKAGFNLKDIENFLQFSPVEIKEAEQKFYDTLDELEKKSDYFSRIPVEAECEKWFNLTFPAIKNVVFNGKIDAIVNYGDNKHIIFDYKSGKRKEELAKIFSEEGVNFLSNNEYSEEKMRQYEYQMPLYYLAALNADEFKKYKNSVSEFGYFYLYPLYEIKKGEYNIFDMQKVEDANQYKEKIIDNIKKYIVDEIRQKSYFETNGDKKACEGCEFKEICDAKKEEDDD